MDIDRDDILRYGRSAAIAAGHDPRAVRQWTEGDIMHFAHYVIHNGGL